MKKAIFYCAYLVSSVIFIVLLLEFSLMLAYSITHNPKFSTLKSTKNYNHLISDYPHNPKEYVKIAIFGESAAAGYNAERGFTEILDYELKTRFPSLKFYIKNYAQPGYPFHRHQAEVVKAVIDKYDIFLIYAGNNEVRNYLDDVGYFKTSKYKERKRLKSPYSQSKGINGVIGFLKYNSRIYAISQKAYNKYLIPLLGKSKVWQYKRFKEFESNKTLPPDEIEKINANFKKDLEEIAILAKERGKYIVISSAPTNESYKPFFSVLKPGLSEKEAEIFYDNYELGLESYNKHEFNKAISHFFVAREIDDHVAILNYFIGNSYLMLGDFEVGRKFLIQSIDDDGYPARSLSSLHRIEAAVSQGYDNIYYIDTVQTFHQLLDRGITYDELFADLNHPSFMGHIIIAYNFLSKISDLEPLKSLLNEKISTEFEPSRLRSLISSLRHELRISRADESWTAFNISRVQISMAGLSAYPKDYLSVAKNKIDEFYDKSDKTSKDEALMLIFTALIEARGGDSLTAVHTANQAFKLAPSNVRATLYRNLATGEMVVDVLREAGISFSKNKFILLSDAKNN